MFFTFCKLNYIASSPTNDNGCQLANTCLKRHALGHFHPHAMAPIAVTTLVAFVLRGLTRFGSTMIGIGVLSTVLLPAQVVLMFLANGSLRRK